MNNNNNEYENSTDLKNTNMIDNKNKDLFIGNSDFFCHLNKNNDDPINIKNLVMWPIASRTMNNQNEITYLEDEDDEEYATTKFLRAHDILLSVDDHFPVEDLNNLKRFLLYFKEISRRLTITNNNYKNIYDVSKHLKAFKYVENIRFTCVTNTYAECLLNFIYALDYIKYNVPLYYNKTYYVLRKISLEIIKEIEKLTMLLVRLKHEKLYTKCNMYYKQYIELESNVKNTILEKVNEFQSILIREYLSFQKKLN
ncbi:hypothetical protein PFAG_04367 [Plasmodium falciparum Santa Lucia]|nr:hypothetical protein PFAG_04367 [Plasmodium falciparum Santa Lucia]